MKPTIEVPVELFEKLIKVANTYWYKDFYNPDSDPSIIIIKEAEKLLEAHKASAEESIVVTKLVGNTANLKTYTLEAEIAFRGNDELLVASIQINSNGDYPVDITEEQLQILPKTFEVALRTSLPCKKNSFERPVTGAILSSDNHSVVTDEMLMAEAKRLSSIFEDSDRNWIPVAKAALSGPTD